MEIFARTLRRALKREATADQHDELVHEVGVFHDVRGADDGTAGVGEIAEAQLFSGRQRMGCGEEDAVAFLQQQPGAQAGSRGIGMKKTAANLARVKGGQLDGGR